MEASLHPSCCVFRSSSSIGFNPCFDGSFSSPRAASAEFRDHADVSILVLMEASLHPVLTKLKGLCGYRFNPCFDGSFSSPLFCTPIKFTCMMFQSLF